MHSLFHVIQADIKSLVFDVVISLVLFVVFVVLIDYGGHFHHQADIHCF